MKVGVKVKFGSRLDVQPGDPLCVTLTERPERGRANKQLLEALSDYYQVPAFSVSIVSGATSRKKVVQLSTLK